MTRRRPTGDARTGSPTGAGSRGGGRPGASSTTPPTRAAPTTVPVTRPAAIAVFPPIARERTSTDRSRGRFRRLHYHVARHAPARRRVGRPASCPRCSPRWASCSLTAGLLSYADPTTAGTAVDRRRPTIDRGCRPRHRRRRSPSVAGAVAVRRTRRSPTPDARSRRPATSGPARSRPGSSSRRSTSTCRSSGATTATRSATSRCTSTTGQAAPRGPFGQPGEGRATYLYAHARDGMFGPIYEHGDPEAPAEKMLGMIVQVYTSDDKLYLYEIHEVAAPPARPRRGVRGATPRSSSGSRPPRGRRARPARPSSGRHLLSVGDADPSDAHPKAKPVNCG